MPEAIRGTAGSGTLTTYTVPRDHTMRLEMVTFTLTTGSAAGVHAPMVSYYDGDLAATTARIWDWNEAGPVMTLYYTFAIGLRPFNCTITTGMTIPNALPDTLLNPDSLVILSALDNANNVISGDSFSNVVLYGELLSTIEDTTGYTALIPGLLPA